MTHPQEHPQETAGLVARLRERARGIGMAGTADERLYLDASDALEQQQREHDGAVDEIRQFTGGEWFLGGAQYLHDALLNIRLEYEARARRAEQAEAALAEAQQDIKSKDAQIWVARDSELYKATYAAEQRVKVVESALETLKAKQRMAPVQGYSAGIPWDMHLRAYDAYCRHYSKQQALIEGGCRGGFGVTELDRFIPGWRDELSVRRQLEADLAAERAARDDWERIAGANGRECQALEAARDENARLWEAMKAERDALLVEIDERREDLTALIAAGAGIEHALAAERAARQQVEQALVNLITKLDAVFADKSYRGVWTLAFVHGVAYNGPNVNVEMEAAKDLLLAAHPPTTPGEET